MRYVPYHQLGAEPNIIVDGSANEHTLLALSHWPGAMVPEPLRADLSAQIVLKYLENPQYRVETDIVSNNHFDEDGLTSLWAMLNPDQVDERRDALLGIARAGDFATYSDRDFARMSFIVSAWTDPELSPLNAAVFAQPYAEQTMVLYEELLPRLTNIIDRFEELERFWKPQDEVLSRSESQLQDGSATIEEFPDIDLAIVNIGVDNSDKLDEQLNRPWAQIVHPFAIHNASQMMRVLLIHGDRYRFYYRYETWIQYTSRVLRPRVDLSTLSESLSRLETTGARWKFGAVTEFVSAMQLEENLRSSIEPARLKEMVVSFLKAAKEAESSERAGMRDPIH